MRKDDLTGARFGSLTVSGDSGQRLNRYILWNCRCDCGGTVMATRQQLTSGHIRDCGCQNPAQKDRTPDLTGLEVGELAVLRRAGNDRYGHPMWLCRCSCGNETTVTGESLRKGRIRSCGCKRFNTFRGRDITGQRFGRLVALYPLPKKNSTTSTLWHCRCDCGAETDAYAAQLKNGSKQSCGCLKTETHVEILNYLHCEDDTCLERLVRATNTTGENRTGFRGLYLTKKGLYRASITFRKVHYTLGYYRTYEDAVKARLDAEECLHAGYIAAIEKYRARAEADPEWAAQNKFYYNVARVGGEFQISTNGV